MKSPLCETIAKGLRLDGYEVDTCFDGGNAWNMAMDESYDLIILDLNLPVMDGMEVLRNIRKEDSETASTNPICTWTLQIRLMVSIAVQMTTYASHSTLKS